MKLDNKTILLILAAVVAAAGLYWYFFMGSSSDLPLSSESVATTPAQAQFETLVGELGPISFNLSLFSDPRFAALVDISTLVTPESAGRIDPFAPLPVAKGP